MKFNITAKLMAAFIVAIMPFFLVTGFGHYSLVKTSKETNKLAYHINELNIINHLTISISQFEQPVHDYLATGDRGLSKKYNILLDKVFQDLKLLDDLKLISGIEYDYCSALKKYLDKLDALSRRVFGYTRNLNPSQVKDSLKELNDNLNSILSILEMFQETSRKELQEMKIKAEKSQKYLYNLLMLSWVGSIVFCILVVFFISNSFSHTIAAIDNAARNIGAGNLDLRVDFKSNDELGELVHTFNEMVDELQNTTVSKDYFDNIIQTMNDVLIVLSLDGVIQSVNETATRTLGYNKGEMIGLTVDQVFSKEHPLRNEELRKEIIRGKTVQKETVCFNKEGKKIPMVFSVSKLHDEPGSIKGIVCVAQDISFQKKAEKDIKHLSQEMIRIQEDERGRMSREIHDNLGGSLLALKINIHSLFTKKGEVDGSKKEEYNRLMDYLNGIIESSRNLSRNLSPVGFKSIGLKRAIVELVNTLNRNKNIDIAMKLSDISNFFPGDWDVNIYRIIQEALNNIIKHSNADKVEISAKSYKNKLTIRIKDNGKGIDFDELSSLESEDIGLGLLIMRERSYLIGGEFEILSRNGKGTVIKIEIPKSKKS